MIRKLNLHKIDYSNWATELSKPITGRPEYRLEADSVEYSRSLPALLEQDSMKQTI